MSLILEALRKSEAERRRGQTPDLLSEATPVAQAAHAATARSRTWLLVVAAATASVLLVLWWMRDAAPPVADTAIAATTRPAAADPRAQATTAAAVPVARITHMPAPINTPASPPRTTTTPNIAPAPATVAIAQPAKAAPAPPTEPTPASPPPTNVAATEPAPTADTPSFISPDTPLRLSELASDEREQLPALKVSMLMWAPDAGNRFAIIDGSRVGEGDRVGEATVEAIQQEGVTLAWRGRRIRLPIR